MLAARLPCRARGSRIGALLAPGKLAASRPFRRHASESAYERACAAARDDPERFWGAAGSRLEWFQPWRRTVKVEDPVFPNWCVSTRGSWLVRWGEAPGRQHVC